jgi:hypothetical protein
MGMSLRSTESCLDYNWAAWDAMVKKVAEWGVDTAPMRFTNDGDLIPPDTCRQVADAIEAHADVAPRWMLEDVPAWRQCGEGFCQL